MPSTSKRQAHLMAACAHPGGRAWAKEKGVQCPPEHVASDYQQADIKKKEGVRGMADGGAAPNYRDVMSAIQELAPSQRGAAFNAAMKSGAFQGQSNYSVMNSIGDLAPSQRGAATAAYISQMGKQPPVEGPGSTAQPADPTQFEQQRQQQYSNNIATLGDALSTYRADPTAPGAASALGAATSGITSPGSGAGAPGSWAAATGIAPPSYGTSFNLSGMPSSMAGPQTPSPLGSPSAGFEQMGRPEYEPRNPGYADGGVARGFRDGGTVNRDDTWVPAAPVGPTGVPGRRPPPSLGQMAQGVNQEVVQPLGRDIANAYWVQRALRAKNPVLDAALNVVPYVGIAANVDDAAHHIAQRDWGGVAMDTAGAAIGLKELNLMRKGLSGAYREMAKMGAKGKRAGANLVGMAGAGGAAYADKVRAEQQQAHQNYGDVSTVDLAKQMQAKGLGGWRQDQSPGYADGGPATPHWWQSMQQHKRDLENAGTDQKRVPAPAQKTTPGATSGKSMREIMREIRREHPPAPTRQYEDVPGMANGGQARGFRRGGKVRGPGTGISDDIETSIPEGSYIMPADSTAKLGEQSIDQMGRDVPVALSDGEYKLPPEQVHAIGVQALDEMKDATHVPAARQAKGFCVEGADEGPRQFFAGGGAVQYGPWSRVEDPEKMRQDRRQRAVYGRTGADVPPVSNVEMANRKAPDTRMSSPVGANAPQPVTRQIQSAQAASIAGPRIMADTKMLPIGGKVPTEKASQTARNFARAQQQNDPGVIAAVREQLAQGPSDVSRFAPSDAGIFGLGMPEPTPAQMGVATPQEREALIERDKREQAQAILDRRSRGLPDVDPRKRAEELGIRYQGEQNRQLMEQDSGAFLDPMVRIPGGIPAAFADNRAAKEYWNVENQRRASAPPPGTAAAPVAPPSGTAAAAGAPSSSTPDRRTASTTAVGSAVGPGALPQSRPSRTQQMDYTAPVAGVPGTFKTVVAPDGRDEYGQAIYSDSALGATRAGLDADIAKYGEGVQAKQDYYSGIDISKMTPAEVAEVKRKVQQQASDVEQAKRYFSVPKDRRGAPSAAVVRAMSPQDPAGFVPGMVIPGAQEAEARGFEVSRVRRIEKLYEDFRKAKTPEEQAEIEKQILVLSGGKGQKMPNPVVVSGGQGLDQNGLPFDKPESLYLPGTGQWVSPPSTDAMPAAPGGIPEPRTKAEYDALPIGAQYMKNGQLRIKGRS